MHKKHKEHIINSINSASIERKPFRHCVIDNFLPLDLANDLEKEFLNYEDDKWFCYKNEIEEKKCLSDWRSFPKNTYECFYFFNSEIFIKNLELVFSEKLLADYGLHGGGWHIHANGGKLNPHLDYEVHPFLGHKRKLNLIIYLSKNWQKEYGGSFGLWEVSSNNEKRINKKINIKFNRALIFDTSQNSWHGLAEKVQCPEEVFRKSLAVYYLQENNNCSGRKRALFAPVENQVDDEKILNLIKERSDFNKSKNSYVR